MGGLLVPGYSRVPRLLRFLRPVLVRTIWALTPNIRLALRRNAAVLLGNRPTREEQRRFGLAVLEEIQRFTDELVQGSKRENEHSGPDVICEGDVQSYFSRREQGNGMVIATAHMGSFEAAACILQDMEPSVHVLYARDPCKSMETLRSRLRKRLGVIEHAVDDGLETWTALRDALANDETVALPADRVQPGQTGFEIEMLGEKTMLPAGPFKLAMTSGAPLAPIFCWRDETGRYRLWVGTPIEFKDGFTRNLSEHPGVKQFVRDLERVLKLYPTQWMMVYEAWPQSSLRAAS